MNTLIKIIITSVIGFLGTHSEAEDKKNDTQGDQLQEIVINNIGMQVDGFCRFSSNSCVTSGCDIPYENI